MEESFCMTDTNAGNTLIIIATYNEKNSIGKLLAEIISIVPGIHILVIDDNSPDGTAAQIKSMRKQYPTIHLIERSGKLGYGSAFLTGFTWGMQQSTYNFFISMDADFSHAPQYIPHLLKAASESDVAIGSRYIPGGGTKNWGVHRKILSRGANIYSCLILGIPVHDCTSGFRCYRRSILEKIDFSKITSDGYSFLEELLYYCHRAGARFCEKPIIFVDREHGRSKLSRKEIFKAILAVPLLRLRKK